MRSRSHGTSRTTVACSAASGARRVRTWPDSVWGPVLDVPDVRRELVGRIRGATWLPKTPTSGSLPARSGRSCSSPSACSGSSSTEQTAWAGSVRAEGGASCRQCVVYRDAGADHHRHPFARVGVEPLAAEGPCRGHRGGSPRLLDIARRPLPGRRRHVRQRRLAAMVRAACAYPIVGVPDLVRQDQ